MDNVFSLDELKEADDTQYAEVPNAYGSKTLVIGSLNSEDMIEWLDSNDDPAKKREGGLRLIVKSVVTNVKRDTEGNILGGDRIPKERREEMLDSFRKKNARSNGKVVKAILELNGLNQAAKTLEALKNASSEASPAASPSASPSQPGA